MVEAEARASLVSFSSFMARIISLSTRRISLLMVAIMSWKAEYNWLCLLLEEEEEEELLPVVVVVVVVVLFVVASEEQILRISYEISIEWEEEDEEMDRRRSGSNSLNTLECV